MAPRREPIKPNITNRVEPEPPLIDAVEAAESDGEPRGKRRGTRRSTGAPKAAQSATAPPMPRAGVIAQGMTRLYAQTGAVVGMFDMGCGSAIMENADSVGKAWEDLAKQNPAIRKALLTLMQGNALFEILAAHTPIILAITAHHGPTENIKNAAGFGVMAMKAASEVDGQ